MKEIRYLLGERIRELRNERGLSQEELGERAGLHSTYIGSVERGEKNVSVAAIEKIADGLHITVADLFVFPESSQDVTRLRQWVLAEVREASSEQLKLILAVLNNAKGLRPKGRAKSKPKKS